MAGTQESQDVEQPSVLIPYPGPSDSGTAQDIFVYLRPETNGVVVESTMLRVIEHCGAYRTHIHLVYLANLPGSFIVRKHIIEQHYSLKLKFAVYGSGIFTPYMRSQFARYFGDDFSDAKVIGSFEALRLLHLSPEELFAFRVPSTDVATINGQCVKRVGDYYVVNYDIPALLHKNNRNTDIAVMIFRTDLNYDYFVGLVQRMLEKLKEENILDGQAHYTRVFHYSRGPFDQILDGSGHLLSPAGEPLGLDQISFCSYLAKNGIDTDQVRGLLEHPIVKYRDETGAECETDLYSWTQHDSYPRALDKLRSIHAQVHIAAVTELPPIVAASVGRIG